MSREAGRSHKRRISIMVHASSTKTKVDNTVEVAGENDGKVFEETQLPLKEDGSFLFSVLRHELRVLCRIARQEMTNYYVHNASEFRTLSSLVYNSHVLK